MIKKIQNTEYQTLLELRYLCFKTWEQIVVEMGYSLQHIFRIYDKALKDVVIPKVESKCDRMRVQSSDTITIGKAYKIYDGHHGEIYGGFAISRL